MFVPWKLSLWLQRLVPGFLLKPLKTAYTTYHAGVMRRMDARLEIIVAQLFPTRPARVVSGPFQGMNYVGASVGSALVPKLVGSYEVELSGAIEHMARHGYDRIFNVGCAEGYYAVGLALRSPKTTVFAFDLAPEAARLCRELADLNGVATRVVFSGACDPAKLNGMIEGDCAILCDCEGYEMTLLDPDLAPRLKDVDMLVELHGATDPNVSITRTLLQRFETTHRSEIIPVVERDPSAYPVLQKLSPEDQALAINEFRADTKEWGLWQHHR